MTPATFGPTAGACGRVRASARRLRSCRRMLARSPADARDPRPPRGPPRTPRFRETGHHCGCSDDAMERIEFGEEQGADPGATFGRPEALAGALRHRLDAFDLAGRCSRSPAAARPASHHPVRRDRPPLRLFGRRRGADRSSAGNEGRLPCDVRPDRRRLRARSDIRSSAPAPTCSKAPAGGSRAGPPRPPPRHEL